MDCRSGSNAFSEQDIGGFASEGAHGNDEVLEDVGDGVQEGGDEGGFTCSRVAPERLDGSSLAHPVDESDDCFLLFFCKVDRDNHGIHP